MFLFCACCASAAAVLSGCGFNPGPGEPPHGSTTVTLISTSTANDQFSQFGMILDSLTLTGKSGATANLIPTPVRAEFMHVNGTSEPLLTASIPQGVYTSATAAIEAPGFTCLNLDPSTGGLYIKTFADNLSTTATVGLPSPITIAGTRMGISLNLLVSSSASAAVCNPAYDGSNSIPTFSVTPVFSLSPLEFSSAPTNGGNGLESGLKGLVASVDAAANSFTVTAADGSQCVPDDGGTGDGCAIESTNGPVVSEYGPTWQVASSNATAWQGIGGISGLAPGQAVDMDATIQPDGSLLATRVAAYDTDATNVSMGIGPLTFVSAAQGYPDLDVFSTEALGPLSLVYYPYNYSNATFQVSGQFSNLGNLPFTPVFTSATMVDGQNFYGTTHVLRPLQSPADVPATTITLLPQTINGTVSAISSQGGFAVYTVTLASYDLFSALATQPGQTTVLTNPNTVVVYADDSTQMLNGSPAAAGSVLRFYGLVFNDGGTLRMDCSQVNDGVAE